MPPHGKRYMSDAEYKRARRVLLARWARQTQTANYLRLRNQVDIDGNPMAPLGPFWTAFKAFKKYRPEIGRKTGEMLAEIGNPRNIKIDAEKGDVTIYSSRNAEIQARVDIFQTGFTRPIKSPAEQRMLESMASQAGILPAKKRFPIGAGPFGVATMLYSPPRPFVKPDRQADVELTMEIANLIITGRRKY